MNKRTLILSALYLAATLLSITACCRHTQGVANSAPPKAFVFGRQLKQLPKVDNPELVDAELLAKATTVIDASLLDYMARLGSADLPEGDALLSHELLLLTFRLTRDPIKGQCRLGAILLQDWSHQILPDGYSFYRPRAVYRIYLEGTTLEDSEWVAVRLLRDHG